MFSSSKKTRQAIQTLHDELSALREHIAEEKSRADADRAISHAIAERITALEARVSGMGSELSRQLHELGTEIEELSKRADDAAVMEVVDALKTAQIRLATEQARYEITFRQDLAALADQLFKRAR
jgi:predicted  nucleic acid-binding Zn-ribbon protein